MVCCAAAWYFRYMVPRDAPAEISTMHTHGGGLRATYIVRMTELLTEYIEHVVIPQVVRSRQTSFFGSIGNRCFPIGFWVPLGGSPECRHCHFSVCLVAWRAFCRAN